MKTFKTQKFTIIMGFMLIPFIFSCGAKSGGEDLTGETPPPNNTTTTTVGLNQITLAPSLTGSSINGATDGAIDATQGTNLDTVLQSNGPVILSSIPRKTTSVTIELEVTGETPGKELEWSVTGLEDNDLRFSDKTKDDTEKTGDIAATETSKKITFTIVATGEKPAGTKTITVKCKYKNEGDTSTEGIYTLLIQGSRTTKEEKRKKDIEDVKNRLKNNNLIKSALAKQLKRGKEKEKKVNQLKKDIKEKSKLIDDKEKEITDLDNQLNIHNGKGKTELSEKLKNIDKDSKTKENKIRSEEYQPRRTKLVYDTAQGIYTLEEYTQLMENLDQEYLNTQVADIIKEANDEKKKLNSEYNSKKTELENNKNNLTTNKTKLETELNDLQDELNNL